MATDLNAIQALNDFPQTPYQSGLSTNTLRFRWIHGQCFQFELPDGKVLMTDPFFPQNPKAWTREDTPMLDVETLGQVDYITINHSHFDHTANLADVFQKSSPVVISDRIIARDLTAAQQQMVEIAKVISKKAKVVIMDEPTSSLSEHEINALFEQLDNLRNNQVTVIYISHRMAEIFRMCDRATILRDGCKVKTCMIKDTTESEIVNSMVGREIKDYYNRQAHTPGKEMLRVEGLTRKKEFKDISFTAYAGEILGFYGLVGAGRTEVMETIFGARRADAGKIFVEGKEVHFRSPKDAIEHNLGMVTEDRRRTGLMLQATLRHNIVLPSLPYHHRRFGFLDNKWEADIAQEMTQKLRVKTPSIQTIIANLSGGNQQKVILAKWLIANSKILILDEPTRGIDVNAKSEFYALMNDFVAEGGCIIMVSSELPEMLGVADRIIVMREGVQGGEISGADATEQSVIQLASVQSNV